MVAMYRVNGDPRSTKSCEMIYEGLKDLLKERSYRLESISITDITRRSQVGRATFYRHFDGTLDVLRWISNSEVERAFSNILTLSSKYELLCYNFFTYWYENSELLDVLVKTQHPDIFLISLERFLVHNREIFFIGSRLTEVSQVYVIDIWAAIAWSILKRWVLNDKQESAEQLTVIAIKNLPRPR